MSASPAEIAWNLLRGPLTARVLGIVAELDVARALADGPRPAAEIAAEAGADPDALYRFLRALSSDGVFTEEEPGVFRNTPASELLVGGSGWNAFAQLFGDVFYRGVGELDASGEASFPRALGADFWSWLAEHPRERALFDLAMEQGKEQRVERFAPVEWRGDETVVDVGGGNGSLLVALLKRQPGLRVIVFDLPETVRDEAALGDRIEFVEGDFFERVPEGDVYVLSTILHDWDDEHAYEDPADDPGRRARRRPAARDRRGRAAGERPGRRQVARRADARGLAGEGARRTAVARALRRRRLRARRVPRGPDRSRPSSGGVSRRSK